MKTALLMMTLLLTSTHAFAEDRPDPLDALGAPRIAGCVIGTIGGGMMSGQKVSKTVSVGLMAGGCVAGSYIVREIISSADAAEATPAQNDLNNTDSEE